ncbi:MAG: TIM44-like domain-containing protein [Planctomycetota bacterium]
MFSPYKLFLGIILLVAILLCSNNLPLWARGGGGCLIEGTCINTPNGQIPIENIKQNDYVISWDGNQIIQVKVLQIIKVYTDEYIEIITYQEVIKATPEHPFFINHSDLKRASDILINDNLLSIKDKCISLVPVLAIRNVSGCYSAYNLIVESPGTFFTQHIAVHNKGCFLPDTEILLANGRKIPISQVKTGDNLLAFTLKGEIISAPVKEIITLESDKYYEIVTNRTILHVTAEHPLYIGNKSFRLAESVNVGDHIFIFNGEKLSMEIIHSKKIVNTPCTVYNLRTDYPNTFFANSVAVHNKGGGCFPAGTMIGTPNGIKPIESIQIGDMVLGVNKNHLIPVKVQEIYSTTSELIEIQTEDTIIRITAEHPLLKMNGEFSLAGTLKNGESLCVYLNKTFSYSKILSVKQIPGLVPVYNIEVDNPHTFIADNIVVHNKGGFRGHGGGGGGEAPGWFMFIFFAVLIIVIVASLRKGKTYPSSQDENLDYCYPLDKIRKKSEKTYKLLTFLSTQDQTILPDLLKKIARDTFEKLQQCWQSREYEPMMPLMMTDLYKEHLRQIESMKRNHEINMIAGLTIDFMEIVNIRYYEKKDKREFTAIIQAKARDYYIDDKTGDFIRGDDTPATFQEFWTFQYDGANWLLRQIEQTKESDILSERNFVEMFTDEQLRQVYGESVSKDTGPIGPALDEGIKIRDDKIHRHLNFLIQTDKIWDENKMKETARNTFINIYLARESGSVEKVQPLLFPEVINSLQNEIDQRKNKGEVIEFRNLCVRKADIVLVRNFTENTKDEFTVRITAHAQRVFKRNNSLISQDTYVSPFEQYWTFGRKDNQWLLKEILPSANVLKYKVDVDEDVSKEQMEWYHTKDRAL